MMDIPAGNALPDPWTGAASQPAYPWRGRITCDPAPGQPGSPEGTAAAAAQVDAFLRRRRRGIIAAWCCTTRSSRVGAGGVDALPDRLGTEGADARALRRRRLSGGRRAGRAGGRREGDRRRRHDRHLWRRLDRIWRARRRCRRTEVRFPLDPLWASPAIDAVGIDYYAPLADWRDERRPSRPRARAIDLRPRLSRAAISAAARLTTGTMPTTPRATAQTAQRHHRRPRQAVGVPRQGSLELVGAAAFRARRRRRACSADRLGAAVASRSGSPKSAVPRSTRAPTSRACFPIRNRPRSRLPYFSNGARDDLIQRRMLEAVLGAFDPAFGADDAHNPVSPVYGGRMVDAVGDPSVDLGRAALSGVSRGASTSGATAPTGRPGTG